MRIAKCTFGVLLACGVIGAAAAKESGRAPWPFWGGDLKNTRHAQSERAISPHNVDSLGVKWVFQTAGNVSATPAVDERHVYVPDWGGYLHAVDRRTGVARWSHAISEYTGRASGVVRATPAISGDRLVFGDLGARAEGEPSGAFLLAVDKRSGALLWKTLVDEHPLSQITMSATVSGSLAIVGVSSGEESAATCCTFRGSVLALDVDTGQVLWKTYLTPPPGPTREESFTGVAAWGSSPAIDARRGLAYVATGNNYSVPASVSACLAAAQGQPNESELARACVLDAPGGRDNHFDSILALDLKTGAIRWSRWSIPFDAWVLACLFGPPSACPNPSGPDYDFGQAPALFSVHTRHGRRELLGAGQKSGQYWALEPDTGEVVWVTQVGPGGSLGGLQWGSAVDGRRVYTAVANWDFKPHTFTTGLQAGRTVVGGFWAALDAATGERLWEMAGTQPPAVPPAGVPADAIASNQGPVSVANGVVFAGALDTLGTMYALDAATGAVLWSFESGGSVNSGPAIADGELYWGSGYQSFAGTSNDKLYAFALDRAH